MGRSLQSLHVPRESCAPLSRLCSAIRCTCHPTCHAQVAWAGREARVRACDRACTSCRAAVDSSAEKLTTARRLRDCSTGVTNTAVRPLGKITKFLHDQPESSVKKCVLDSSRTADAISRRELHPRRVSSGSLYYSAPSPARDAALPHPRAGHSPAPLACAQITDGNRGLDGPRCTDHRPRPDGPQRQRAGCGGKDVDRGMEAVCEMP